MRSNASSPGVVIVEAGPGGLAPLFAAAGQQQLAAYLGQGVTILERSERLGLEWLLPLDASAAQFAQKFLQAVFASQDPALLPLRSHGATRSLRQYDPANAPKAIIAAFLAAAGNAMLDVVRHTPGCCVCMNTEATEMRPLPDGGWHITARNLRTGAVEEFHAQHVVVASTTAAPVGDLVDPGYMAQPSADAHPGHMGNPRKDLLAADDETSASGRPMASVEDIDDVRRRMAEKQDARDGKAARPEAALAQSAVEKVTATSDAPMPHLRLPLFRPSPPPLSEHTAELADLERSGVYTGRGPVNARFEQELTSSLFGSGECLTVSNGTVGLMLAIREAIGERPQPWRKYALMPSFGFAATAQAALWCGLTPLLCDIDPETWLPSHQSEDMLLRSYAGQVAVIVPYATFGNSLDLERYARLSRQHKIPVVVDAAGSLGSTDQNGRAFGSGFQFSVVFSMHAAKAFSSGEGGVIYSADPDRMRRIRQMSSFGFDEDRTATMPGLNATLSEVAALSALLQLQAFPEVVQKREELSRAYAGALGDEFRMQRTCGHNQARAFESVLLPAHLAQSRKQIVDSLRQAGVGADTYFSPHLAEHPYIRRRCVTGPLPVTAEVAARMLTLPLLTDMTADDVRFVENALRDALADASRNTDRSTDRGTDRIAGCTAEPAAANAASIDSVA